MKMNHDWMIDVLNDMVTYANNNGLHVIARQTLSTKQVVEKEIKGQITYLNSP